VVYLADDDVSVRFASFRQLVKRAGTPNALRWAHHRYLGYYPAPNFQDGGIEHNPLGYRGKEIVLPKPDNEFRIVCMGGSTTYDDSLDYCQTYPALLEDQLREEGYNVTIVNAGVDAWASYEILIALAFRVSYLDADMIVLYSGLNDFASRIVWPPEAYKGDNSGTRPAFPSFLDAGIWEHSTLLRIILVSWGGAEPISSLFLTWDSSSSSNHFFDFIYQIRAGTYPSGVFAQAPLRQILEQNPPLYFSRNLEHIVAIARERNMGVILATFAYANTAKGLKRSFGIDERRADVAKDVMWGIEQMNGVIRRVAAKTDADLFDFAKVFPNDLDYYFDGVHNNERGAALKAQLFARFICESHVIPERFRNFGARAN